MQVVLKESIRGLGNTGDLVNVRDGFARNFLLPRGKAVAPNQDVIRSLKKERLQYLDKESDRIGAANVLKEAMAELKLDLTMKANEAGQLFGSVTEAIVAEALSEKMEIEFKKDQVVLGTHFKRVGEYIGIIRLHTEVETEIALNVIAEETEEARDERLAAAEAARLAEEEAEAEEAEGEEASDTETVES